MPQDYTIQRFAGVIYVISTVVALSILGFTILLYIGFHDSKLAWTNYSDKELRLRIALSDLKEHEGYGGFIHNFKNLVLRGDLSRYPALIDRDIKNVRANISKLDQMLTTEPEKRALANFQSTFDEYVRKYSTAKELIAKGVPPARIDKMVKVPDEKAISALHFLTVAIDNRVERAADRHRGAMRQLFLIGIGGGIYLFVLLVFTSAVEFWLMRQLIHADVNLKNTQARLERANLSLTKFLGSMSHEIRTPLTSVIGYAQLLDMKLSDDELKANAKEIVNAGEYMFHLVNELLDLTAIETGNVKFQFSTQDMVTLLHRCIDIIKPLANKRSIEIDNKASGETPIQIYVDNRRIQQVLLNILSNAVKFNHDHGRITVDAESNANHVRIDISDTGTGLNEAQIEKIFVPFDRLGAEERQVEGVGLGMAISKELVEKMGGEIGLESKPGVGTRVWVSLPKADGPPGNPA